MDVLQKVVDLTAPRPADGARLKARETRHDPDARLPRWCRPVRRPLPLRSLHWGPLRRRLNRCLPLSLWLLLRADRDARLGGLEWKAVKVRAETPMKPWARPGADGAPRESLV